MDTDELLTRLTEVVAERHFAISRIEESRGPLKRSVKRQVRFFTREGQRLVSKLTALQVDRRLIGDSVQAGARLYKS